MRHLRAALALASMILAAPAAAVDKPIPSTVMEYLQTHHRADKPQVDRDFYWQQLWLTMRHDGHYSCENPDLPRCVMTAGRYVFDMFGAEMLIQIVRVNRRENTGERWLCTRLKDQRGVCVNWDTGTVGIARPIYPKDDRYLPIDFEFHAPAF
jgi:hypothetical protein